MAKKENPVDESVVSSEEPEVLKVKTVKLADGTEVTYYPDGSKKTVNLDSVETVEPGDGSKVITRPDGTVINVPREQYHRVMFSAQSSENDTIDVHLIVNGEGLIIQREKPVVLPDKFLEVARHGYYVKYKQRPDVPRKIVAKVQTYPFSVLENDVDPALFFQMKAEGIKLQAAERAKYNVA